MLGEKTGGWGTGKRVERSPEREDESKQRASQRKEAEKCLYMPVLVTSIDVVVGLINL